MLAFEFITRGLPTEDIIAFNIRDICELAPGIFGFCKECTREECMLIAACLDILGHLAKSMGVPICLCNIGGGSLALLYNNINTSLFESITPHMVHLSLLMRHRHTCYPEGPEQQMEVVLTSLKPLLENIGHPENLQAMVVDRRIKMVRDLSHLHSEEERESAKQTVLEHFRDRTQPSLQERNDNVLLDIAWKYGRKQYRGKTTKVKAYISSDGLPSVIEWNDPYFRMVYERESQMVVKRRLAEVVKEAAKRAMVYERESQMVVKRCLAEVVKEVAKRAKAEEKRVAEAAKRAKAEEKRVAWEEENRRMRTKAEEILVAWEEEKHIYVEQQRLAEEEEKEQERLTKEAAKQAKEEKKRLFKEEERRLAKEANLANEEKQRPAWEEENRRIRIHVEEQRLAEEAAKEQLRLAKEAAKCVKEDQERRAKEPTQANTLTNIVDPLPTDCLIGAGSNYHSGNKLYHQRVEDKKELYRRSKQSDKKGIAMDIVEEWRGMNPPGRFLKQDVHTRYWTDVGNGKAREMTSRALRSK